MLPGVYTSIERSWYWPDWARSSHYLGVRERAHLRYQVDRSPPIHLFSFVGSTTSHPVRRRLMEIDHPRAVLLDSGAGPGDPGGLTEDEYQRRYAESLGDSAFVLCPRGGGTASFRLFEAMMLGRAPVIVSDQWLPPVGPDWDSFSVRVGESEVQTIPAALEERADEAAAMGELARAAWLEWFSESVSFHSVIEWCLELTASAPRREGLRRHAPRVQFLRPYHAARWTARRLALRGNQL